MARYLMAVTVGPIQDFINAARRTRDLWFGSNVLSEISGAAAAAFPRDGLIFPDRESLDTKAGISNVILAVVEHDDPKKLAGLVKQGAKEKWCEKAAAVFKKHGDAVDTARWERQVNDVVEFEAAWVLFPDDDLYQLQRRRVMRLLAGRKACRVFEPSPENEMRVPKSSLDGARETVLQKGLTAEQRKELRIGEGEQLDAVGLTKRQGGSVRQYPSVSRIAADPWLYGLDRRDGYQAAKLRDACKALERGGTQTQIPRQKFPQFNHFPYEGTIVYIDRHQELAKESQDPETPAKLKALKLRDLYRTDAAKGPPSPYLAILSADGDRMGKLISDIAEYKDHQKFSNALAGFARSAGDILQRHYGALIFAGGDDVLALVPVDMALFCARELHDSFDACLLEFCRARNLDRPTLSVGIGIGHFMEPLEDLRAYAKAAEKAAKGSDRNGLAIHFHTRGGEPSQIRGRWSDVFYTRLQQLIELYKNGKLADKAGYELEVCARRYDGLKDEKWPARILPDESAYLLGRKKGAANAEDLKKALTGVTDAKSLHGFARELMISRRVAEIWRQAEGRMPQPKGAA